MKKRRPALPESHKERLLDVLRGEAPRGPRPHPRFSRPSPRFQTRKSLRKIEEYALALARKDENHDAFDFLNLDVNPEENYVGVGRRRVCQVYREWEQNKPPLEKNVPERFRRTEFRTSYDKAISWAEERLRKAVEDAT